MTCDGPLIDPLDRAKDLIRQARDLIVAAKGAAEEGPTENFDRWAYTGDAIRGLGDAMYALEREAETRG